VAVAPTPGEKFVGYVPPPMVISQPGDRLIPTGTDVILSATGAGGPPLRYQWRFNGLNLAAATSPTLILTNFQFSQAGVYNILVYNGAGSALGTNFTLTARLGLKITSQPVSRVQVADQGTYDCLVSDD